MGREGLCSSRLRILHRTRKTNLTRSNIVANFPRAYSVSLIGDWVGRMAEKMRISSLTVALLAVLCACAGPATRMTEASEEGPARDRVRFTGCF
jgi:hypothetical protein